MSFVLGHYVKEGVTELDDSKLGTLLKLKYNNALADAFAELGSADAVRRNFIGFQNISIRALRGMNTVPNLFPLQCGSIQKYSRLIRWHNEILWVGEPQTNSH